MAFFLFQLVFMDTAATIVTGGMAERWKFSAFIVFGVFMAAVVYPIYGNWIWGGGWLSALGRNVGLRPRRIGLRRLGCSPCGRRLLGSGRSHSAWAAVGQVQQGRQPQRHPRPPHPDGHLGHYHPGVRVDGLQRRLDPLSRRPALQRHHRQHHDRRLGRSPLGDVLGVEALGQARPIDDRERHACRPRGHHRALCLRHPLGGVRHRRHRGPVGGRVGDLRRARAEGRRPGRRRLGARRERTVGRFWRWASSPTARTARDSTGWPSLSGVCSTATPANSWPS